MEPARVGRSRCASNGARPLPCLIGQPRTFLNRKKGASYRSHSKNAPVIKVYPPISKTDGAITDGKISMKRSSRTRAIHEAKSRRRRHGPREFVTCCNWPDAQNLGVGGTYAGAVHVSWETITCATSSLLRCLDSDSFTSAAQFVVVTYSQSVKSASRYEIVTLPDGFLFPALHPTACTILLLLLLHFASRWLGHDALNWLQVLLQRWW